MKPRLAVVTPYFPIREEPYRGHSAYHTLKHMTGEMEIEVFSPIATYPSWLKPRSYRYHRASTNWSPPGLKAHYFEYPAVPVLTRPVNSWLCRRKITPHLRAFRPDLVLNYWLYPEGHATVFAARELGAKSIVCAIGSDVRRIPDATTRRRVVETLRTADFVLAVSEELRQQEVALGAPPERTRTILNGYDSSIFYPRNRREAREALKLGQEEQIVLYVGSLIAPKGLRELLQAAKSLHARRPNLRVYCIGEGPLRQELEGAASYFLLPGRTDSPGVANWMAAADVFCLPSYSEGCPNVVIEAIACGRPVIATNVGGIPEILNELRGALIPPQDAGALEQALESALSRAWDPASLAGGFVRPWETVAEETLQVCRQLLQTQ